MDEFAQSLKVKSEQNALKRIERCAEERAKKTEAITKEIETWFQEIIKDYKEKMEIASEDGCRFCILNEFNSNDVVERYKKRFLIHGPYNNYGKGRGTEYFRNINIHPLKERLTDFFNPIKLEIKYNNNEKMNKIIVYW